MDMTFEQFVKTMYGTGGNYLLSVTAFMVEDRATDTARN